MRFLLLAGLWIAPACAADDLSPLSAPEQPKCEKAIRSRFWPEEANHDAREAVRLAREGKLMICTRDSWRFKWRAVAMNIRAAERERLRKR